MQSNCFSIIYYRQNGFLRSIAEEFRVLQGASGGVYDCARQSKQRSKARNYPQDKKNLRIARLACPPSLCELWRASFARFVTLRLFLQAKKIYG